MRLPLFRTACTAFALIPTLPSARALTAEEIGRLPPAANRPVDFARDIKPILETSCVKCHGRGRDKGKFNLDSFEHLMRGGESGAPLVPGGSTESILIELVAGIDPDYVMPQKGKRLTPDQVGLLRAWIDQGAKWDPAVSFAKPAPANMDVVEPTLPAKAEHSHPVDRLLSAYFSEHKIPAASPVTDAVFARRVWLDTIGLLPTAAELHAFAEDRRADKRQRLVERLLGNNPDYATHWLAFWNDLLRNDYQGTGYIDGGRKAITPWLFAALEQNKPYDQFVAELVNPKPESDGFVKGIVWRGVVNASMTPPMQAAQNVSQVFMGTNLKCASCHDSFVDDWTLADAYGLAGVYSDQALEMVECDKPTGKTAAPKFIYQKLGSIDANASRPERLARLAELITGRQNGRLTRTFVNRLWQRFFGYGLVEPVDVMDKPGWNQAVLDWLAEDFANHGYDVKHTIEVMLTSQAYQRPAVFAPKLPGADFVFRGPLVRRMTAEQFSDAVSAVTRVWNEKPSQKIIDNHWSGHQFPVVRASLVPANPLQVALGRPNREQVVTVRSSVATTLEALELTNGGELTTRLSKGADVILARNPNPRARAIVDDIYLSALGRRPTRVERGLATPLLGKPVRKEGIEDLLWAITMLPEFQLIY
ncbi:MAG: PSD1 and planctomycete cytochrome C domain-containing protein [Opitutus sp.]